MTPLLRSSNAPPAKAPCSPSFATLPAPSSALLPMASISRAASQGVLRCGVQAPVRRTLIQVLQALHGTRNGLLELVHRMTGGGQPHVDVFQAMRSRVQLQGLQVVGKPETSS